MGAASRQNRAMLGIMLGPCYQLRRLVVALRLQQGGSCQAKVRRLISRSGSAANRHSAQHGSRSEPFKLLHPLTSYHSSGAARMVFLYGAVSVMTAQRWPSPAGLSGSTCQRWN